MRKSLLVLIFLACPAIASQDNISHPPTGAKLLEQTGVSSILAEIPQEIAQAASRHAVRCNSSPIEYKRAAQDMLQDLEARIDRRFSNAAVAQLIDWYNSPTGLKVQRLEKGNIDYELMVEHVPDSTRKPLILRLYDNTHTASLNSGVAVNLEYAGWLISGCLQEKEKSGDERAIRSSRIYSQAIKADKAIFEKIFEQETLHGMSYVLSRLSEDELLEYAEITNQYAHVYETMVQSLLESIESSYQKRMQQYISLAVNNP